MLKGQIIAYAGSAFVAGALMLGIGSDADISIYHRFQACVTDFDNVPDCSDGIDNDGDGYTDMADGSCADPRDPSEGVCVGDTLGTGTRGLGISAIQVTPAINVASNDSSQSVVVASSAPSVAPAISDTNDESNSDDSGSTLPPIETYENDQDIGRKKPRCNNGGGNGSEGCSPSENGHDDEIDDGIVHGINDKSPKGETNQ